MPSGGAPPAARGPRGARMREPASVISAAAGPGMRESEVDFLAGPDLGERTENATGHFGRGCISTAEVLKHESSNTSTSEYDYNSMKEDVSCGPQGSSGSPVRRRSSLLRTGGQAGRVVQVAPAAVDGLAPLIRQAGELSGRIGKPALGVMGGLIQPVASPARGFLGPVQRRCAAATTRQLSVRAGTEFPHAENGSRPSAAPRPESAAPNSSPPVSSLPTAFPHRTPEEPAGSIVSPAKTPAPNSMPDQFRPSSGNHRAAGGRTGSASGSDVKSGDVSPLRRTAPAARRVIPTGHHKAGNRRRNLSRSSAG
jgi:hypothetical protein